VVCDRPSILGTSELKVLTSEKSRRLRVLIEKKSSQLASVGGISTLNRFRRGQEKLQSYIMIREIFRVIIEPAFNKALEARSHSFFGVNAAFASAIRALMLIHAFLRE